MKRILILLSIGCLIFSGCSKDEESTENAALSGDLELEDNQTLVYGTITSIYGNEITYNVVEESSSDISSSSGPTGNGEMQTSDTMSEGPGNNQSSTTNSSSSDTSGQASEHSSGSGGPPSDMSNSSSDSGAPSGTMSDSSSDSGTPSGTMGDSSSDTNMPGNTSDSATTSDASGSSDSENTDSSSSSDSATSESSNKQATIYTATGEEETMLIPVGTTVTTLLGVESTFSRIAVDNTIAMVMEKNADNEDVIVAVYIVG